MLSGHDSMIILLFPSSISISSQSVVNQNYIENEALVSTVDFPVQSTLSWERSITLTLHWKRGFGKYSRLSRSINGILGKVYLFNRFEQLGTYQMFVHFWVGINVQKMQNIFVSKHLKKSRKYMNEQISLIYQLSSQDNLSARPSPSEPKSLSFQSLSFKETGEFH